jgi:small GTP-binding protein
MKLSIGIVGLPNVGKSTLFKALTKIEVNIANYPFATIDPNVGVVPITDERLEKIAQVIGSKEILPAVFEFVDIAGLVKGAHQGAGLGNQFLAHIREVDAIIHLVRIFKDKEIVHFEAEPDPLNDFETILSELKLKDEQSKEKVNLLSAKPQLIVLNGEPEDAPEKLLNEIKSLNFPYLIIDLKKDLTEADLKEIFEEFLKSLNLITFFTANENEARSWLVKKGTKAPQAAGIVHTDFEKKFIRAEVINWQKLLEAGSWTKSKQKGWLRLEGKEYVVADGDVMEIKHG